MRSKNRVIIAAAGSGKTTTLVKMAIASPKKKIAIITYTINNFNEIKKKFYEINDSIPSNVTVMTWFTFLLRDGARPYQNYIYNKNRIESVYFPDDIGSFKKQRRGIGKENIAKYYFTKGKYIIADNVSDFVCRCNEVSKGLVIDRVERLYDMIFIDEVQDLAGWDLEFIRLLYCSKIATLLVGDPRQYVYSTNHSNKNSRYRGLNIILFFEELKQCGACDIVYHTKSHRCNQLICDLADSLYLGKFPRTKSENNKVSGHDGIFIVHNRNVCKYAEKFSPAILRYNKLTKTYNDNEAVNFGNSKGLTFDRVLIFPNGPIKNYLSTGDVRQVQKSAERLYVAITRARYSVAFVFDDEFHIDNASFFTD